MEGMTAGYGLTYFPKRGVYVPGLQEEYQVGSPILAASKMTPAEHDEKGNLTKDYSWKTTQLSASIRKAVKMAKSLYHQYQQTGILTAADSNLSGDELAPLILVRLHQQIMGEMQKWFHLSAAFNTIQVDQLLYRMPFQDNPAAAQRVPARGQYDINKVQYFEAFLELTKAVNSYDIAWEDKLRATIDFEPILKKNLNYSIDFLREVDAANELAKLNDPALGGEVWDNSGSGAFLDKDTTTKASALATTKKINPTKLNANNPHSAERVVDDILFSMQEFTKLNSLHIDTAVCSPKTMMRIAANTWTENNTIFNVEAYRTNGGVRAFPGIPGVQMIAALAIPDDRLYLFSKASNTFVLAEGPKQMQDWNDPTRFRRIHAQADFYTHKYMIEDFSRRKTGTTNKIDERFFGYTIGVHHTA